MTFCLSVSKAWVVSPLIGGGDTLNLNYYNQIHLNVLYSEAMGMLKHCSLSLPHTLYHLRAQVTYLIFLIWRKSSLLTDIAYPKNQSYTTIRTQDLTGIQKMQGNYKENISHPHWDLLPLQLVTIFLMRWMTSCRYISWSKMALLTTILVTTSARLTSLSLHQNRGRQNQKVR